MTRFLNVWFVPLGALLSLALFWAMLIGLIDHQHRSALSQAGSRAESVVRLAQESLRRTLDAAAGMQELAQIEVESGPRTPAERAASPVYRELARMAAREHFGVLQIAVTDRQGTMLWSTIDPSAMPIDLSDRMHIKVPLSGVRGTFIGEVVIGRVSNRRTVQITRRMEDADGKLLGVVVASFDPLSLLPFFTDLGLSPEDEALVIRPGGMILISSQGAERVGNILPKSDVLLQTSGGQGVQRLDLKGAPSFVAVRHLDGVPLTIAVALDEETAMAEFLIYRRDLYRSGWVTTIVAFCLVLAITGWQRRRSRLAETTIKLAAAHAGEARFRMFAEAIGDMVLVHEPNGRISHVSNAALRILGLDSTSLLGTSLVARVNPQDVGAFQRTIARAASEGTARTREYRVLAANGDWVWLETAFESLGEENGGTRLISTSREIGARIEAERLLQKAHAELEHLMQAAPVWLYGLNATRDGGWTKAFFAPSITRLMGWSGDEVLRAGWWHDNVHPDDAEKALVVRREAFFKRQVSQEFRFRRANGEWRWIQESLYRPENGGYDLVGSWVDVTEEHVLRSQLVQTSKLATLGEMATGMAHELNQPLAVISTVVEGLLERQEAGLSPSREQLQIKLRRLLKMTHRAASIINHMRVFGRVSGERVEAVDWPSVLDGALTILSAQLTTQNVQVDHQWPEALPPVSGEAIQLEQVLINLLSNACDAFEQNGIPPEHRRVRFSAFCNQDRVELVVQDNAGGVPEECLAKVFDPFFTTKAVGKGTGLGLSVSFGIIRDLGGFLRVENADMPHCGYGARFSINLPVSPASIYEVADRAISLELNY